MSKSDGGPAFGAFKVDGGTDEPAILNQFSIRHDGGMSLRDWFAGMAMQAVTGRMHEAFAKDKAGFDECSQLVSELAYAQADAMLEERAK